MDKTAGMCDNNVMLIRNFRRHSILAGTVLTIIGAVGMVLPPLASLSISFLVGFLLILSGVVSGYQVFLSYRKSMMVWLKPFLLVVTGLLILIYPVAGIAAVGIMLAIYFLMDAFAGFSMMFELHELKGTLWLAINSVVSLILGITLIAGWPTSSILLVGLFVGISLFMDGISLLILGLVFPRE